MKITDDEIAAAVVQALNADPRVADLDLGVHVAAGVITLTGTVSTWGVKMAAQDAVRNAVRPLACAMDVRNRLEFPMGEGARLTDADLARAVRLALERELPTLGPRVRFTVSAGWVTLEGGVDGWKIHSALEGAIRRLPGVLGVANRVEIQGVIASQADSQRAGARA